MTEPAVPDRKRRWLVAGSAIVAAAAGAGLYRWGERPGASDGGAAEHLWTLDFQTPQGTSVALAGFKGRPLLLNFWATWCPPCVEEMPLLEAFYRQNAAKGWQVLGLAVDQPSAVRRWLQRVPITFPIGLAGLDGTELAKSLGNKVGGLPFSVVFAPGGEVRERRMGRVSDADLQAWALVS